MRPMGVQGLRGPPRLLLGIREGCALDEFRPPRSVSEIASLPAPGTTEYEAFVRANADTFAPETLVYLLRQAAAGANSALFERCAHALTGTPGPDGRRLGGHCEGIIVSIAKNYRFHREPQ